MAMAASTTTSAETAGEDGGFPERLIGQRTTTTKTSVETQTLLDDPTFYQRKITPRVPKRCRIAVYLATGTAIIVEPEKGISCSAKELLQAIVESEELALPAYASEVFSLWMASSFLEVQLKPGQLPLGIRKIWKRLLHNYSTATHLEAESDDPRICLRRSTFLTLHEEMRLSDEKILELFYAEARHNILSGRYPCEVDDYSALGALQACIEMGSFNPETHTMDFFRQNQRQFLPENVCEATWIPSFLLGRKRFSPSHLLLENFRRISPTTPSRKLVRKYLELCWSLPYYGSAMFHGQVESPSKGLWSFLDHPDNFVLVAVNSHSLHVIDYYRNRILIGARFESFKIELGWPAHDANPNCFPCLFLQFMEPDNSRTSKMLQIFSKQAPMMDALITRFHLGRSRNGFVDTVDDVDNMVGVESSDIEGDLMNTLRTVTQCGDETSCLSNKLRELSLATFDENGLCVAQSGSWAFAQ